MKCNICGAEFEIGEKICKFCGNELSLQSEKDSIAEDIDTFYKEKENLTVKRNEEHEPDRDKKLKTVEEPIKNRFCTRCGRPLDDLSNKCTVCDNEKIGNVGYKKVSAETEELVMGRTGSRKRKNKKSNKPLVFIVLMVTMVVLFLASAIVVSRLWDGEWENPTPTPTANVSEVDDEQTDRPVIRATTKPTATPKPEEKKTEKPSETEKPISTEPPEDNPEARLDYYGGTYLFPSHEEVISETELEASSRKIIKLMLHEIYARYGYTFEDEDLVEYFEAQNWYTPVTSDLEKVEEQLNETEKENVKIITEYQRKMGWRL